MCLSSCIALQLLSIDYYHNSFPLQILDLTFTSKYPVLAEVLISPSTQYAVMLGRRDITQPKWRVIKPQVWSFLA